MRTISITPPKGWTPPEAAHFAPESPLGHSATLIPDSALEALEAVKQRKCATCGDAFDAVGLTALCDPCGIKVDELAALPPVRKLDSSWPRLHADKLDSMIPCICPPQVPGQKRQRCATCMAIELCPKLFGNRLLVLAGDRGRGKTQIATFIAYHRLTKGHDCGVYTRVSDMARMCDGYSADARKSLLAFQKVPFLCVDECHRMESRQIQVVESILDARYANKRPTMLIGNWLTKKGVLDGEDVSGQKLYGLGPTLMDRINEHAANQTGGIYFCRWGSYRTGPANGPACAEPRETGRSFNQ